MSKQIEVEVQGDHLDKVSKANALTAISELVWNAVDADATVVEIAIDDGELGIDAIHVKDNGHGIDFAKADMYFRGLGGSWKGSKGISPKGRFLHGKEGQGRFKSFSVGRVVEWNTRYKVQEDSVVGYCIKGLADNKKFFDLGELVDTGLATTGTTVSIYELLKEFSSLAQAKIVEHLTSTFAIYLSMYQEVSLSVNGEKIDPDSLVINSELIELPKVTYEGNNYSYELQIIEWKNSKKKQVQLCNQAGFPLLPIDKKIRGGAEFSFTAYLKSEHITELNRQGRLGLGDLEPSLKAPVEEAARQIKDYLMRRKVENSAHLIEKWKGEDVYPYKEVVSGHVEQAEKQMFDILAININELMPEFDRASLQLKKLQFGLLKQIVASQPTDLHAILIEVLNLSEDKQREFAELLKDASLSAIISATKIVTDRLKFLAGLEEIVFNPEIKSVLKERSQLHKILEENTWIFGEQFSLSVSDKSLTQVLRKHLESKRIDLIPDSPVKRLDESVGIVDLMLTRNIAKNHPTQREHLIVELKAPKVKIGQDELNQIKSYAYAVAEDERFSSLDTSWNFWLISTDLDSFTRRELKEDRQQKGLLYNAEGVKIWVKTWGEIINECKHRMEFIRQQLDLNVDSSDGLEFLRKHYGNYTKGIEVGNKPQVA
ncbi:ATP-binding protein [Vibrio alginolyticus]|nr:ATP-binding protein [Vibrio alginolyticus]